MDNVNMIILIIEFAVLAVSIFIGRNIVSKVSADDITNTVNKINLVIDYADKFVSYAKQFMQEDSGEQKMNKVVGLLKSVANKYNVDISEVEIRAIAQKAYDNMKLSELHYLECSSDSGTILNSEEPNTGTA